MPVLKARAPRAVFLGALFAGSAALAYTLAPQPSYVRGESPRATSTTLHGFFATFGADEEQPLAPQPRSGHVATPEQVKGIYMSQCVVGTPSFREKLVRLVEETELNAIVIDIRDYTGYISFDTDHPLLKEYVSTQCGASDMREFIAMLHEKDIYVIGRITTFQNPAYTKNHPDQAVQRKGGGVWKDHKGLAFVDVGAKPYWETVVALAKESYDIGFDELNFDYIRFPSDGDMAATDYSWSRGKSKPEALEEFYRYLHAELQPEGMTPGVNAPVISADLFGMVTTNEDDLNIGQVLERALPYFDYICPMVYPSHYPSGFHGYKDVNAHSYGIVHFSMEEAVRRTTATTTSIGSFAYTRLGTSTPVLYEKPSYSASKMRPWLQSFDYPVTYTAAMVREQIQANEDAGLQGYLFWDPANKYRALEQALAQSHE